MKSKSIIFNISIVIIRLALVCAFLFGVYMCLIWYPIGASITSGIGFGLDEVEITPMMELEFYDNLIFYWVVSAPCFVIVCLGFWSTVLAKREGVFSIKLAKTLFIMALILSTASVAFLAGDLVFWIRPLGWSRFALNYCIVGVSGLAVSGVLYVAYKYIIKKTTARQKDGHY